LKDDLDVAGNSLAKAMKGSVSNIEALRKESERACDVMKEMSSTVGSSAVVIGDSLETARTKFNRIASEADTFCNGISAGLGEVEKSVGRFSGLAEQTQKITQNMHGVAAEIDGLASTVRNATSQSQLVIDQVGRFIDKVFENRASTQRS
jgi:methyl-accepting chemotaxis protein